MSSMLGPVHFWLYKKIVLQEDLTRKIAERFPGHEKDVCGRMLPLQEIIDEANIHGWLQNRICDAESRYAHLVTEILKEKGEAALEEMEKIAYHFGQQNRIRANVSRGPFSAMETVDLATEESWEADGGEIGAKDAYLALEDALLNGMPCDRINQVVEEDDTFVRWEQTMDLHRDFWTRVGGDSVVYDRIRGQVIRGMLDHTGLTYTREADGTECLSR